MYTTKQLIARGLFIIETCALILLFLYGASGLESIYKLERENSVLKGETVRMAQEVDAIEQEIASWSHDDFYKEKVAREQLQMARKDDEVYYTS